MFKIETISHFGIIGKCILVALTLSYILFPNQIFARQIIISSSDLPYTASTPWDTITFASSKIFTSGNGIFVTADNVTINLYTDTLEFGTGGGDNKYGIKNDYNIEGLKIYGSPGLNNGGTIIHGGDGWDNTCVIVNDAFEDFLIEDVDMEIYGWDGHNVECWDKEGNDLTISGGSWINHVEGFTSRGSFDAVCLKAEGVDSLVVHDLIIDCWHSGMYFGDKTKAIVYNCSLLVDARNDLYSYPTQAMYQTSAASCGIHLWIPASGTDIYNNIVIAGIENEGCEQAITADYAVGTAVNPIRIHDNFAILHRGPDDHYGDAMTCKGYKQRWSNKYTYIYDNEFHISAHADSGAHAAAWGKNIEGFMWQSTTENYGEEGDYCDSFTIVENNRCFVEALSAGCEAIGVLMTIRGENDNPPFDFTGAGNIWRNNYFKTSSYGYFMGQWDGGSCRTFLAVGDTLESYGDEDFHSYQLGSWNGPSRYNIVRDLTYLGGATDDDIVYEDNPAANGSDLALERTLEIYIKGNNNMAVANAACSLWNGYNQLVYSGFSNSLGFDTIFVEYYHGFKNKTDSSYNNFTIKVDKEDNSSSAILTIEGNIGGVQSAATIYQEFNLDISGSVIDSIPPADISDLRVTSGK